MSDKDGGPAFPATNYIIPQDLEERYVAALGKTQGMTLRDYFAAKAMQALAIYDPPKIDTIANNAYKWADAMLKAREGPK